MNRKLAFSLALLMILMVVSATSMPIQAASYNIGVAAGNTADYTATMTATSSISSVHLLINNVTGTKAGIALTPHLTNGSTMPAQTMYIDVASTSFNSFFFILIAANLTTNDPIYPSAPVTLNQSSYMVVTGANRTVNHFKSTFGGTAYYDVYWDKLTGLIVKGNMYISSAGGWVNLTMSGNNIWAAGAGTILGVSTTELVAIVVIVVIVIAVAFLLLRRRK
jgi:hypothetical protein